MRCPRRGRQLAALRCPLLRYLIAVKFLRVRSGRYQRHRRVLTFFVLYMWFFVHALMEICTWLYSCVTTFRTLNILRLFTKAWMDGYPAGGWGDSNEPESRSSFRAVPVLAHQTELSWPSFNSSWSSRCGVGRSGLAALLRVPRRPAHGSAGTWKICRLACHCELFHKTGIARGRDEQRCFRRVQNYFGVLREKELFDRRFFLFPQASLAG